MVTIAEALSLGTRHHQEGRLAEAERLYRQVLAVDADNPQALHLLGMLAMQARQFEAAVELIGRAIRVDRTQAAFHANLGEAYRHLGKPSEAVECYRQALKIQPGLVQAHTRLGMLFRGQGKHAEAVESLREALRLRPEDTEARMLLGLTLDDQNKWTEAEACFRRVLRGDERSIEAHFNLGAVLQSQGRLEEAVASYRAVLVLNPEHVDAHNNLGTILKEQNALDEAVAHFETALRLKPGYAAAHVNLGVIYELREQYEAACGEYRSALAVDPRSIAAWTGLGAALQKLGQIDQALDCYRQVLAIDPNHAPTHLGIGSALQLQGMMEDAFASYLEAARVDPNYAEAYNNLGMLLSEQGQRDKALACCMRAIELRPDFGPAHSNVAVTLQALGRLDESIEHHRKAVELVAEGAIQHSNLLYALNYHPAYGAAALFAEHRAWGMRHADPLTANAAPHANPRSPDRRLRVGYVSPFFRHHAVNFFSEPILVSHDHDRFEVFCYSDTSHEDETTARLRRSVDHWRHVLGQSDQQVSELVRRDQIDILVDLTGHIDGGKRLLVFARKPAPIQVTYIGYQNTTGMLAMDYRLTDDYSDPPGMTEAYYTETLVRLPRTFFTYLPDKAAPPINALPALTNGYVTFASVNNFSKITPQVLKTWAEILLRVPRSRLILRADMTDSMRQYLSETFAAHGVELQRLELVNRLPRNEYLELICRADIALDPFPFNGHTTTCDCLWQGVPVITLSGQTYVTRFGGSALATLGLDDLIAHTQEQYVEIAAAWAGDVERLTQLRSSLRDRMAQSPLVDAQSFTRNLEAAYRRMWERWCAS